MSDGRRIFIGDVHGQYHALMLLIDTIVPNADDRVYFLGDLIDRGPQSSRVIDFVRQHGYQSLMGNHEQMFLESFMDGQIYPPGLQAWLYSGGQETVASYTDVDHLISHLEWVKSLPLCLDLGDVFLAHAGVNPHMTLKEQTSQELCWIRAEFHSSPYPYFVDKLIITGHTITFTFPNVEPGELVQGQGWLDIDTGAYHPRSGWLTALSIDEQKVYQANAYTGDSRTLALDELVVSLEPEVVKDRYQRLRVKS